MDGVGLMACQGSPVCILLVRAGSLLSGVQKKCPVVNLGMSMGLVWLWAVHLLMLRVVLLLCWRISVVCLALHLVHSWVELGFSVGVETFG